MTEHESLVEAILDHPEDMTRRLVYADWLEENGDFADGIRARLIRLEARLAAAKKDAEREAIKDEMKALNARYSWLMIPPLPPGFENPSLSLGLVRIRVSTALPRFIEWGEDYLRGLPPFCRLNLWLNRSPAKGKLATVLDAPAWPRVYELCLFKPYRADSEEMAGFLGDVRLRGLEQLYLRGCAIDDAALVALAEAGATHRMTELTLWDNPIGSAGLEALMDRPTLPCLRRLALYKGSISRSVVSEFCKRRPEVELHLSD